MARLSLRAVAMKAILAAIAVAMLMSYEPAVTPAPVLQTQSPYFFSSEERFLNTIMVRAYNAGDTASLKELLLYWQDEHGATAL